MAGRVALVTGAGKRVGQAIALALAEAGYDLQIHYGASAAGAEETATRCRALGVKASTVPADLADPAAIRSMFDKVRTNSGRLDLLVNSAAGFERLAIGDITVEQWDRMHAVNLRAPFLCAQAALPLMPDGGHIINIVDIGGGSIVWPHYAHYISAKAGLAGLTRAMALELAPRIRVNGVSPGTVLWGDDTPESVRQRVVSKIPLGRIGDPGDIARSVVFLATGPDFITGQILAVDGGQSVNSGGL